MRGVEKAAGVAEFRVLTAPVAEPPLGCVAEPPLYSGAEPADVGPPAEPGSTVPGAAAAGPDGAAPVDGAAAGVADGVAGNPDPQRFVLSTLRPMFEVLDRRRPARHLTAIATGTVVDVLRTLSEQVPRSATVSGWGRVHVCPADSGAEIHLTYRRGGRVLAAAGRVEFGSGRWRWVAFTTAA